MKPSLDRERRLFDALKRISAYMSPERLRRDAQKNYGLCYAEALEYAYENVLHEAKLGLKGMRRPPAARSAAGANGPEANPVPDGPASTRAA